MFSTLKKLMVVASLVAILPFTVQAQSAASTKDVVVDTNGNIIHNTFGNCVRTKWEASKDACGGDAPVPTPVQATPRVMAPAGKLPHSRSYLVFFDWDKSVLTQESRDILEKLVVDSKAKKAESFDVTGHADRSGSDSYNEALSERRAQAVKSYLSELNVDQSDVKTAAKGESEPLVPTEDNVREPQNRRVEIIYYYVE